LEEKENATCYFILKEQIVYDSLKNIICRHE